MLTYIGFLKSRISDNWDDSTLLSSTLFPKVLYRKKGNRFYGTTSWILGQTQHVLVLVHIYALWCRADTSVIIPMTNIITRSWSLPWAWIWPHSPKQGSRQPLRNCLVLCFGKLKLLKISYFLNSIGMGLRDYVHSSPENTTL